MQEALSTGMLRVRATCSYYSHWCLHYYTNTHEIKECIRPAVTGHCVLVNYMQSFGKGHYWFSYLLQLNNETFHFKGLTQSLCVVCTSVGENRACESWTVCTQKQNILCDNVHVCNSMCVQLSIHMQINMGKRKKNAFLHDEILI